MRCRLGGLLSLVCLVVCGNCQSEPTAVSEVPSASMETVAPAVDFNITSEFGAESEWTEDYLQKCASALIGLMDNAHVQPPSFVTVELRRDPNLPGIGGWASAQGIGFVSDQWPAGADRYWILAHELANLFAHHYAGGGGFPSDFWSNGRSPFPEYVSCLVMRRAGYPEEAIWRKVINKGKPDHDLYWRLDGDYGFSLFSRFFKLLQADGVVLGDIGAAWPAPDRTRSLYTIAYLSIAADEKLAPLFRGAGVGTEPADWNGRHPDIPFEEYEIGDAAVERIMKLRAELFSRQLHGANLEVRRRRFRQGAWRAAESAR